MPRRNRAYMEKRNNEGGFGFFSPENMAKYKDKRIRTNYQRMIDKNYLVINHYHGVVWFEFVEKTGELIEIKRVK